MSTQSRQLAAIMFTDIVGYTAMMQKDEKYAVAVSLHYISILKQFVITHSGEILNDYGDGSLCVFRSATEAVHCALEIQKQFQSEPVVPLRIGLHIGEIFFEEEKVFGDGVNVASRIQSLGQANTILFSKEIFDKVRNHPEFKAVSLGYFDFKNVDEPMEVFALANGELIVPKKEQMSGKVKVDSSKKKKPIRRNIIIATSVLIVLLFAGFLLYKQFFLYSEFTVTEKSIAVLPFKNLSNDTTQEYFAEGMREEVLNHLYKIGGLTIMSSVPSGVYKESKKTNKEIAAELGVGNLLKVSVQKEGKLIRIIAQLINGKTDQRLWGDTYDREFKDVFIIQSDIAQQIAAALKVKIDPETKSRIEYIPTENTSAYNIYLLSKDKAFDDNKGWKELLEKVIRLDSSFAPAYADMAVYWLNRGHYRGDLNAKQVLDSALPLLNRSIELDSNLSSAHLYLALTNLWFKWDFSAAEREWRKFFQLNPSGFLWVENYADFLSASGRPFEALDFALKNRDRDKKEITNWTSLAMSYYFMNQPDKALMILDSAWLFLKDPILFEFKAWVLTYLGKYEQAIVNLGKGIETFPDHHKIPRFNAWLAISHFHTDKMKETEKILDSLQSLSKQSPVGSPAFYLAIVYTATGRIELAFQWLEKAYAEREVEMFWLKVEPMFNSLHNDPRFKELLNKVGFH